ncbi:MAG TPA: hypothetical protein VEL74_23650 [Thermoanaerobaculia bacterium]|nr:hypothetical protein [Thermoanaerobaculia bacterium]
MTTKTIRTAVVLTGLLVAVSAPSWAQRRAYERDGAFRLHAGLFTPDGESEYWDDKAVDFTGDAQDLENVSIGGDYLHSLGPRLSLLFSGNYFQGDTTQSYVDFVDNFGDRIRHDTTLEIASLTAGLVLHLTEPGAAIRPYIGVAGGLYSWSVVEEGDFIDEDNLEIFSARLESDGNVLGYYGLAGLEVPIGRTVSLFGEGRWSQVEDELSGDLEGLGDIDLSGRQLAVGISWSL